MLLSLGHGFESRAQHLRFFDEIVVKVETLFSIKKSLKRTKINKKRPGVANNFFEKRIVKIRKKGEDKEYHFMRIKTR